MAVDHIRYDILAQEALLGVVRTVLADAAKRGLPGDHHFSITFRTAAEGVRLSPRLREQWPEEMTIILQHQFWDLGVTDEAFEVGLSFGGIPERLRVPFGAITQFLDPSVQFGLRFELADAVASSAARPTAPMPTTAKRSDKSRPQADAQTPRAAPKDPSAPLPMPASPTPNGDDSPDKPEPPSGGEVVRLDRFRKK